MAGGCKDIKLALQFAFNAGNEIQETSKNWTSEKKVIHMKGKLSESLKAKILDRIEQLEYWQDDGSQHGLPREGFYCNKCEIRITFPL